MDGPTNERTDGLAKTIYLLTYFLCPGYYCQANLWPNYPIIYLFWGIKTQVQFPVHFSILFTSHHLAQ